MVALRCRHPPGIPSARLVIPRALQEEKRAGSHAACRQPSCPAWHVPSHQHEQAGGASGHCQPRDTANSQAELHSPAPSPRSACPGVLGSAAPRVLPLLLQPEGPKGHSVT